MQSTVRLDLECRTALTSIALALEAENPLVDPETWRRSGGNIPESELKDATCFGALDLSSKNDLTALILDFPLDDGDAVLSYFWTPKDGIRKREEQDRAPYGQWVRDGYLKTTPGKTIDYSFIAREIGALKQQFNLASIAFDRWRIDDMIRALDEEGVDIDLVPHGQGFKDMNPSIEAMEDALLEGRMRHGNHPVLTWCISNAQVEKDAAGNRKFTKRKSTGRIDGAVALAMAAGLASYQQQVEPQFFVIG